MVDNITSKVMRHTASALLDPTKTLCKKISGLSPKPPNFCSNLHRLPLAPVSRVVTPFVPSPSPWRVTWARHPAPPWRPLSPSSRGGVGVGRAKLRPSPSPCTVCPFSDRARGERPRPHWSGGCTYKMMAETGTDQSWGAADGGAAGSRLERSLQTWRWDYSDMIGNIGWGHSCLINCMMHCLKCVHFIYPNMM